MTSGPGRGLKKLHPIAQTHIHTNRQTDKHGDSITESVQWDRFSEKSFMPFSLKFKISNIFSNHVVLMWYYHFPFVSDIETQVSSSKEFLAIFSHFRTISAIFSYFQPLLAILSTFSNVPPVITINQFPAISRQVQAF